MLLTINLKLWKIIGDDFSDGRQSPSDALNNWPLTKIHQGNNPCLDIFAWIRISRHCIEDGNGRRRSWHILLAGEVQWTSSLASWWNKWVRIFIYLASQCLTLGQHPRQRQGARQAEQRNLLFQKALKRFKLVNQRSILTHQSPGAQ